MTGYEEHLLARAEELDETSGLAATLTEIHSGAAAAGVDRQAVLNLEAAITILGHGVPAYHPGGRGDRHPGSGYGSDVEFIEALAGAEDEIRGWLHTAVMLYAEVGAALERAQKDLEQARQDLAAAYAMSTNKPCNGCHGAKAAAIAAAEAAIEDAERRIGVCEAAGDILDALTERLRAALARVGRVPHDLGEVYELVAAFIQSGGVMPRFGRWVTGEPAGDRARHDSGRAQPQPQPATPAARQGTATFSVVQAGLIRKADRAIRDALRSQANGNSEQADRDFAAARGYRAQAAGYQPPVRG